MLSNWRIYGQKKKVKEKATNNHNKNDDLFYTRSCETS